MKRIIPLLLLICSLFSVKSVEAAVRVTPTKEATITATVIPTVIPTIEEVKSNLVENKIEIADSKVEKWNGFNSLKVLISWAMSRGVASNTIVLLLLLPLIATLISVLHYMGGLSGYGIFMPTMIAIAFIATGIFGGLVLFAMILLISVLSSLVLRKLKIHFWPARAISLLFISLGTFLLMIASSFIKLIDIRQISIFPILFMILLTEEFTRTQLVKSKNEAKKLTVGTIILAITGAIMMNFNWLQGIVLKYPEIVVILVLVINLLVGNYTGIRLSEIKRFKGAIREKKK
ncbi:MAG: 7TM domain-containing protein [Candidatus Shapirobacteria bacterium]|nr:7TM domain-containing protein [Candidatus Shapirobacteria bacterium]